MIAGVAFPSSLVEKILDTTVVPTTLARIVVPVTFVVTVVPTEAPTIVHCDHHMGAYSARYQ